MADHRSAAPAPAKRPILIVLHQEHSTPGRIGQRLIARGYRLDVCRPRFADPLPQTLADHSGAVIFGGPMSANDNDDYLRRETEWIGLPLREGAPFLGVCLGAQMLARHLGATVGPHPDGRVQLGYYDLKPTEAGRNLIAWPDRVHNFNREGFSLPLGATLLAEGDIFRNQAFSFGPSAFAIQFHIELTTAMVGRWTGRMGERAKAPGAQAITDHLTGRALHDWKTARFLDAFIDKWLASDPRDPVPARVAAE